MAKPTPVLTLTPYEDSEGVHMLQSIFDPGDNQGITPIHIIKDYNGALELDIWSIQAYYRTEEDVKQYCQHIVQGFDNVCRVTFILEASTKIAIITMFSNN